MLKRKIKISEGIEFRGIGGYVKRLVNPATTGSVNLGTSILFLNPGEEVVMHSHEYEEAYFIISGQGKMILENEIIILEKNLSVYVPSNSLHGQKNDGEETLTILCSLSPAPKIE